MARVGIERRILYANDFAEKSIAGTTFVVSAFATSIPDDNNIGDCNVELLEHPEEGVVIDVCADYLAYLLTSWERF